jgi:hypothetical protein
MFPAARIPDVVASIVARPRGEQSEDRILVGKNAQTGSEAHHLLFIGYRGLSQRAQGLRLSTHFLVIK